MTAQSVKMMPISIAGSWQTVLLLRAVDRENSALRHEPVWTRGGRGAQLLLNIHYEDFLLAAAARDGINSFFLSDLWSAAERLDNKGFVPEVFQTEFLIRIAEVSFFPAAAVLALVIAWNYRAAFRVRYSLFPMFFVLPVVFSLLGILLRSMVRAALIFSLLSWGFVPALIALVLASVFGFALCVFLLAAQRS
jgi:lipopolysaccharide export LptBFGC system permease protein LptF